MRFVYVMSQEDKNKMLSFGFSLLKEDESNHVWVFANLPVMTFDDEDRLLNAGISFVLSDMLTF